MGGDGARDRGRVAQSGREGVGVLGVAREGRDGRAGPGQGDGQGPGVARGGNSLGQLGAQAQGGRLQVVDEAVAQLLGSPAQGGNLLGCWLGQGGAPAASTRSNSRNTSGVDRPSRDRSMTQW